ATAPRGLYPRPLRDALPILFDFRAPRTLEEAARILDGERANAMPLAGGTDLLPNMKRRQQVPRMLMSMRGTCCRRFMLGSRSVPPASGIAFARSPSRMRAASSSVRGARKSNKIGRASRRGRGYNPRGAVA